MMGYWWTKSCKPVTGKLINTFPNFFLKDLTWSDNVNNMFLGPVVAAQQVLDPSPQTSHPRKERKGGGGGGGGSLSEHVCTSLLQSKHLDSFSTVIHSIRVFGSLQARSSGLGHCKRDSDWYF